MSVALTRILFCAPPIVFIISCLINYILCYTDKGVDSLLDMFLFATSFISACVFYSKEHAFESLKFVNFSSFKDILCVIGVLIPVVMKIVCIVKDRKNFT